MPDPNSSAPADNLQFLAGVFSQLDAAHESVAVCAFPESPEERAASGRGWPAYHPLDGNIRRRVESQAQENNTYFCISSVDPTQRPLNRRASSLCATYVFPLDDIGTGPGAKYSPDSVPLPPSVIVETSERNFQYLYLPREPVKDTPRAQALLTAMCGDHGDSGGSIAAKYIRLPVGWNSKDTRLVNDRPFQVRLVQYNPDVRYSTDELMQAFRVTEDDLAPARRRQNRMTIGALLGKTESLDPVMGWLEEAGYVQGGIDAAGFATVTCPWASAHSGGSDTAGYSPKGEGGSYADDRQFRCLHDHCSEHTTAEFLAWTIDNGGPDLSENSLERFIERYVYCNAGDWVFDLTRPQLAPLPLQSFHNTCANKFYYQPRDTGKPLKIMLSKEWQASKKRSTVDSLGFAPGEALRYTDSVDGSARLNTYTPRVLGEETLDLDKVGPIIKHLKYLFGDDYSAALDYLAATIHAPGRRLQYALLHISLNHGTGRGWLKKLLHLLLPHTKTTAIKAITDSDYNDWLYESTLVMFDEVYEKGSARYDLGDRMRELITEDRIDVNIKYGFKGTASVYANFLLLSNHIDALNIPDKDRRLWCVLLEAEPMDNGYYQHLYAVLDDNTALNQFWWLLKRRLDTGGIDFSQAPRNATKELMQNAGRDDVSDAVKHALDLLRHHGATVVWRGHLNALLRAAGLELPHEDNTPEGRHVMAVLREAGCSQIHSRCRPSKAFLEAFPGQKHLQRLIAVQDVQQWHSALSEAAKGEAERAGVVAELIPTATGSSKLRSVT